jgi:transposase InsO family protein
MLEVRRRISEASLRDKPIAPASPWQNAYAERLIGSIRRECVDHLIIAGEVASAPNAESNYNKTRTHRSLEKDARSFAKFSGRALSERMRFLAAFITDTSESTFRHRQDDSTALKPSIALRLPTSPAEALEKSRAPLLIIDAERDDRNCLFHLFFFLALRALGPCAREPTP